MARFGLWYDFRNPRQWSRPLREVYAETFEQVRWAEQLGYDDIWTTEHHFVDDDYTPSLLPICAAIAAQTSHVRIGTAVLLLPLHNPLRVAEDAATVDVISGGRLDLGVGLGYRLAEFAAMGIPAKQRGRRMDEALAVLRQSWESRSLAFQGEFYSYGEVDVTPKPVQQPMPLWVGGISEAAARRAARLGTGFIAGAGIDYIPAYLAECARARRTAGGIVKGLPVHAVSEDPEAAWARIGPHLHYQRRRYVEWLNEAGTEVWPAPASIDDIRTVEPDVVVTPARAREVVAGVLAEHREVTNFYWNPALPGLPARESAAALELFAREVAPAFRD